MSRCSKQSWYELWHFILIWLIHSSLLGHLSRHLHCWETWILLKRICFSHAVIFLSQMKGLSNLKKIIRGINFSNVSSLSFPVFFTLYNWIFQNLLTAGTPMNRIASERIVTRKLTPFLVALAKRHFSMSNLENRGTKI
jgi:hypothetical protein